MKIHEYQAMELLRRYGVEAPEGQAVFSSDEAEKAARLMGGPVILKAQVHTGGRGKAGGIRRASSPEEANKIAAGMLGSRLITKQTGPEGKLIGCLFVTACVDISKEYYVSFTVDGDASRVMMLASSAGGVDIEETAMNMPEKIVRQPIDNSIGLRPYQARLVADKIGVSSELINNFIKTAMKLYQLFVEKDCSLVELNPLAETADGRLVPLDAKISFDDNALFRHNDIADMRDMGEEDPKEAAAARYGLSYISLSGNIGCMVNGAGLAMATMDIIRHFGGEPANFLDVGGGATAEKVAAAFEILLSDCGIKSILINIFGGIMKCDIVAQGIISAAKKTGVEIPIVVRLEGANAGLGKALIKDSGMEIVPAATLTEAVHKAVELSGKEVPA